MVFSVRRGDSSPREGQTITLPRDPDDPSSEPVHPPAPTSPPASPSTPRPPSALGPLAVFFAIAYATSFLGGYLSTAYPSPWWILFVYGPFVAGLVVTLRESGRQGVRAWLGRIVRWRVGAGWYAAALLLPMALQGAALAVNRSFGAAIDTAALPTAARDLVPQLLVLVLFIGLAEEPGFRGYALQRLLPGRPALGAALIVGALHAVWHLPLFVQGSEPLTIVPIIVAGAVLIGWVYVGTGGSVLLTMLMHASVNAGSAFVGQLLAPADLARQTSILAVVYVLAAAGLVALVGPGLGGERTLADRLQHLLDTPEG